MGDNTVRKVEKGADKLAKKSSKSKSFSNKMENLGKLELHLKYDSNGSLSVYLGKAKGLPSKDMVGSSDPYAKVYLLQSNPAALFEKGHEQTKSFKNNLNPDFNDTFVFKGIDRTMLLNSKLCVSIWDKDMVMADEYMCGVRVQMSHFSYDGPKGNLNVKFWANLQTSYLDGHPLEVSESTLNTYLVPAAFTESHTSKTSVAAAGSSSSSASSTPSIKKRSVMERLNANLTFKVSFVSSGYLKVYLMRAQDLPDKDLIGKSDPYAKVYLLDENNKRFIDSNKKQKTKTKKNTQNPEFHEEFQFSMNLQLIRTLRTVIEIWDDDFGKDQFLAGVMFTMSSFNLSTEVELTVPLYSGLNSNLPFEVDDVMRFSVKKFSSVPLARPGSFSSHSSSSSSSSSSDEDDDGRNYLRQSNYKLISYIEKARIMAQAYGIGRSIPNEINVEESVNANQSRDVEFDASTQLYPILNQIKEKVRRAREEEARLRDRNNQLKHQYDERKRILAEKDRSIWDLESEIAALQGKITVIQAEFLRIRELSESLEREHDYYLIQLEEARNAGKNFNFDHTQREIEIKNQELRASLTVETEKKIEERVSEVQIPISVYMKFKERMEKELEAKRKEYLKSVGKLQIESKQILAMYDNIVRAKERGSIASHRKTSMMEKIGFYRGDMSKIESEIGNLKLELARMQAEYDRKKGDFDSQLRLKHAEFEAFRKQFEVDLQKWFERYGAEFNAWCREQVELAIYSKLIEFEEHRLAAMGRDQGFTAARVSTAKSRSSYATGPIVQESTRHTYEHHSGDLSSARSSARSTSRTYSSTSGAAYGSSGWSSQAAAITGAASGQSTGYNYSKRKESGYHSPGTKTPGNKTPDSTLDRDSRYSDVFDNIKNDMNEMHI